MVLRIQIWTGALLPSLSYSDIDNRLVIDDDARASFRLSRQSVRHGICRRSREAWHDVMVLVLLVSEANIYRISQQYTSWS